MAELPYGAATASGWECTGAGCGKMPEKIYYGTNSQMKAKKMAEWISVKDRLPNKDMEVLCYSIRDDLFIGRYLEAIYTEDVYVFVDTSRWYARGVTHWMPLPQLPKGE